MLLRDPLCKHRDIRRSQWLCVWSFRNALPGGQLVVCILSAKEVHRQCHDRVGHFPVSVECLLDIPADTGGISDLFKKPDIPIKAVVILALYGRSSRLSVAGQLFEFAQIPAFRKS